jgi:hypothetical protein
MRTVSLRHRRAGRFRHNFADEIEREFYGGK